MNNDDLAQAHAENELTQEERKEILALGFSKFQKLMEEATRYLEIFNDKGVLTPKQQEEFLKIPLAVRKKAMQNI